MTEVEDVLKPEIPTHDKKLFGESRQAYHAFCHYRDLGPIRSINKAYLEHRGKCLKMPVSKHLNPNSRNAPISGDWKRWSSKWKWVNRAEHRDMELDRLNIVVQDEERKAMSQRLAAASDSVLDKVERRLREFNPDELAPRELVQWLDMAAKISKIARGDAKEENSPVEQTGIIEIHEYADKGSAKLKRIK